MITPISKRVRGSFGPEPVICIPRDMAGGYRVQRARRAVLWLWSRGIYPGPAAIGMRLYGHISRSLSGVETAVRNQVMRELKIPRQRRDDRFLGEVKP